MKFYPAVDADGKKQLRTTKELAFLIGGEEFRHPVGSNMRFDP